MKRLTLLLAVALNGCGALPQDFSGTADRVRSDHEFRVGLIAGSGVSRCPDLVAPFLARVTAAASATPQLRRGPAEPLLSALRRGELDLVIGELDARSPWDTEVTILEPLSTQCRNGVDLAAAARNGENRWIMLLEHEQRALQQSGSGA